MPLEAEFMLADTLEHLRPDTPRFASFQQAQAAALKLEADEEHEALKAAVLLAKSRVGAFALPVVALVGDALALRHSSPCPAPSCPLTRDIATHTHAYSRCQA